MKSVNFPAHIRIEETGETIQSVECHCRNTAKYTADALNCVGLKETGFLLGMTHDCGKMTTAFSNYIERAANGEAVRKGSVNHTFAAVKLILENCHCRREKPMHSVAAELLAFAVGAHHGLFDCVGPDLKNGFEHRLSSEKSLYVEAMDNFSKVYSPIEVMEQFSKACAEIEPISNHLIKMAERDATGEELCFYFGLLARLLLSALIDSDRRDTAEFMKGEKRMAGSSLSKRDWKRYLDRVETKLDTLTGDGDIQQMRALLSQRCRMRATVNCGIYRLNLPTGAGKTLTSLRFALAHAVEHGKSRIVFTSPLLSILEQNAAVIRSYLQDDTIILEHHSNIVRTDINQEELSVTELFTESWSAPIIITTLVQLLNTLFNGKTASIRRFHSLCDSVIVIDEIQTLPTKMLSMFQLTVSFLAEVCGATIVLCSATQPAQEDTTHPYHTKPEDLVPYDATIWKKFRRTELSELRGCALEEIPEIAKDFLKETDSILIVCNKKDEAASIYNALKCPEYNCFHLSASMCIEHRRKTIDAIKEALGDTVRRTDGKKTICVSTQVIEAGVDISFGCALRLTAGMDNVVQTAGRCNRNGESKVPAPVFILDCINENLSHLGEIKAAKDATLALLAEYRKCQKKFGGDLLSDASIEYYYRQLYRDMPKNAMDYPAGACGTLLDLLSRNTKYATEYSESYGQYAFCQAFKTAGDLFSVFDTQSESVLVPYEDGERIIAQIREIGDRFDPETINKLHYLLELAKPYTISVYSYQLERLRRRGVIDSICHDGVLVLQPDCFGDIPYSDEIGLIDGKEW